MKLKYFFLFLLQACICNILSAQESIYNNNKIAVNAVELGFRDASGNVGNYDGGLLHFQVKIESVRLCLFSSNIIVKGLIQDDLGNQVGDVISFIGHDDINKNTIRKTGLNNVNINGCFKVKVDLNKQECLYFEWFSYSILKLEFARIE